MSERDKRSVRFRRSVADTQARLLDRDALELTLQRLVDDGDITAAQRDALRAAVDAQADGSRYVLRHLAAHLAIGAVFAFDVVPLPLGTIARVSWVAGSRVVETARRNPEQARVHSIGVFALAAVPWVGYAAYLLPLRRRSAELGFVLANQSWVNRTGRTYEQFLAGSRAPIRRIGRWLVPAPTREDGG